MAANSRARTAKDARAAGPAEQPMGATNPGNSAGARTANGSLLAGAATVTFAARYQYIEVKNESATAGEIWYVRTDGVTPASPWSDAYAVAAGERVLVPNCAPLFYQGWGCVDGTKNNPGTTVRIVSSSSSSTAGYEVAGIG